MSLTEAEIQAGHTAVQPLEAMQARPPAAHTPEQWEAAHIPAAATLHPTTTAAARRARLPHPERQGWRMLQMSHLSTARMAEIQMANGGMVVLHMEKRHIHFMYRRVFRI